MNKKLYKKNNNENQISLSNLIKVILFKIKLINLIYLSYLNMLKIIFE